MNPCITVIDTEGTGEGTGEDDCRNGIALAEQIKQIGSIDAFVLVFKGSSRRIDKSMHDQIKRYMKIFGPEMWQYVITEFTFWSHSRRYRERRQERGMNEETQHTLWNKEYSEKFGVQQTIPSVFIDPIFDEERADALEVKTSLENNDKFWSRLTRHLRPFRYNMKAKHHRDFLTATPSWIIKQCDVGGGKEG